MENKNIIRESRINFNTEEEYEAYRKREAFREIAETYSRARAERALSQIICSSHKWITRQDVPDPRWAYILRRNKNHAQKAEKNTAVYAQEAQRARV